MSADQDNGPEIVELGRDHKELRQTMSELSTAMARLEGKIDTQTQLMKQFSERQDRNEGRVDDLDRQMRKEVRRLEEKHTSLSQKVWMGMGAISLVALLPAILRFLSAVGG